MLGNINNVGDYDYFSTYQQGGNYNFEDGIVNGIQEAKPANTTLGWGKGCHYRCRSGLFYLQRLN